MQSMRMIVGQVRRQMIGPTDLRTLRENVSEVRFADIWQILALVATLAGLLARDNALLALAALLLAGLGVAWVWWKLALLGVSYGRTFSENRAFLGEKVTITLSISNRKPLPLTWMRLEDTFPDELPLDNGHVVRSNVTNLGMLTNFFSLAPYERVSRRYTVECTQRGYYAFGPAVLQAGDPFGLYVRTEQDERQQWLIIYPRVYTLSALGLPAKEPFGELRAKRPLFTDPSRTQGVRDHQPEDDFRHMHWKATARRGQLQVRVFEPATDLDVVIFLNVATLPRSWEGVIPELLERAISVSASLAAYASEQRWPVGLIANGALPRSDQPLKVLPGRSPSQLMHILEMLAAVTPFATMTIEALLQRESARLPWGATLVVVTATLTDDLLATLLNLRDVGRRLVLVALGTQRPPYEQLLGMVVYHLPGPDDGRRTTDDGSWISNAFAGQVTDGA